MTLDPQKLASALQISSRAAEIYVSSDVFDMHIDTFIWHRVFGYDLRREHGTGPLDARFMGQADIPRVRASGITGAQWVITTNPLRTRRGKRDVFFRNFARLCELLESAEGVQIVASAREYEAVRALGKHAAFLAVQGGNALEFDLADFDRIPQNRLIRITLVHFTRSRIGAPALPRALRFGPQGLTDFGRAYVERLNEKRIFVDLAHLSREGFFDALEVHDRSLPIVVTHAGAEGVFPHFRNVTDEQIKRVADTGGVIGIMLQASFLGSGTVNVDTVAEHLAHFVRVGGEDCAAFGSDFDGAIITPRDLKTVREVPRLVDALLKRGMSEQAVRKILGANYLRALRQLRP